MGFISRTKITRYWPVKGQKHPIDRARWRQKSGAATELVSPHYTLALGAGGFLGRFFTLSAVTLKPAMPLCGLFPPGKQTAVARNTQREARAGEPRDF